MLTVLSNTQPASAQSLEEAVAPGMSIHLHLNTFDYNLHLSWVLD